MYRNSTAPVTKQTLPSQGGDPCLPIVIMDLEAFVWSPLELGS